MKFLKKVFLIALLIMALPTIALAAGDEPAKYVITEVFSIALLGFATYWIVEGLKLTIPSLAGFGTQIAAVVVAMVLAQTTDLINLFVAPQFWPLVTDVLIIAATYLVANGIKRIEKNARASLARANPEPPF